MEFKKLELEQEGNWIKRFWANPQNKKTVIYALIGGIGGFLYFYFTQGQHLSSIPGNEIFKSVALGMFFGIFITNSPCARGKC